MAAVVTKNIIRIFSRSCIFSKIIHFLLFTYRPSLLIPKLHIPSGCVKMWLAILTSLTSTCIFHASSCGFDTYVQVTAHRYVEIRVTYASKSLTLIRQNDISEYDVTSLFVDVQATTSPKKSINIKISRIYHMFISLTRKTFLAYEWRHTTEDEQCSIDVDYLKVIFTRNNRRYC